MNRIMGRFALEVAMGWLAEDVMTRNVLCVYADMDLRELSKLLVDREISGAPVTARDGTLIGVVSEIDLLRYGWGRGKGRTVSDVLTPIVHSVKEKTPVETIAKLMRSKRIHRVIVERNGRAVGIISALDLVAVLSTAMTRKKRISRKK
jgi:CBS domain-containing protein